MKAAFRPSQQIPRSAQGQSQVTPTISERQAAEDCGYFERGCRNPVRAFQKWAVRAGVPVKRVGRQRRYDPRVLNAFMDGEGWTARHRPVKAVTRNLSLAHGATVPERQQEV